MMTSIRQALLEMLADGRFHSGEQLGRQLGMTRTAIGKHIQALEELGLEFHRVTGKGTRLAQPLELLNSRQIERETGVPVEYFPLIGSTNSYVMEHISELPKGAVCLAEHQSAGRGRRGRRWVSPFASHIYMTQCWCLEQGMSSAMGLSLAVGIALAETLEAFGIQGIELKWPNDVYAHGRKLAGILVEMSATAGGDCHLAIGIGINYRMPELQGQAIDQPWADISQLSQVPLSRNQLIISLIKRLTQVLLDFEQQGFAGFVQRWQSWDRYYQKPVQLMLGEKVLQGISQGVDQQGALLLEQDGEVRPFMGGEISLRAG